MQTGAGKIEPAGISEVGPDKGEGDMGYGAGEPGEGGCRPLTRRGFVPAGVIGKKWPRGFCAPGGRAMEQQGQRQQQRQKAEVSARPLVTVSSRMRMSNHIDQCSM